MNVTALISQPEGRRLEFKQQLNKPLELAKTIVSFANDAGGELIIGVQDNPRKLVGVPEEELLSLEEQISNIIFEHCQPIIVPEISFQQVDGICVYQYTVAISCSRCSGSHSKCSCPSGLCAYGKRYQSGYLR